MADATTILAGLAEGAPEPGGLVENEIVHRGDSDLPMPIVVSSISSAGYTYIYDTLTGDRSMTNNNMLPTQLKKVRPNGSKVFTLVRPTVNPTIGQIKCILHTESPERQKYQDYGWATCEADHFRSEFHLERHMAAKHRAEWAALKDARDKAEKADDRAFQRAILTERHQPPQYQPTKPAANKEK